MMTAPCSILLDTNICLDHYIDVRGNYDETQALINACKDKGVELLFSIFTLRDVYYHVGAYLKHRMRADGDEVTAEKAAIAEQFAWQMTINLNEKGTLVPADSSDFVVARYFHQVHPDLEDDFILAAVERSEADYLITRDQQLLSRAPVAAITPADMLTLLQGTE